MHQASFEDPSSFGTVTGRPLFAGMPDNVGELHPQSTPSITSWKDAGAVDSVCEGIEDAMSAPPRPGVSPKVRCGGVIGGCDWEAPANAGIAIGNPPGQSARAVPKDTTQILSSDHEI